MRRIESLDALPTGGLPHGSTVAIGKFDGVHLGHQAILRRLAAAAEADGCESIVFTFRSNPLSLLRPDACPQPVMSAEQRLEAIAETGVTTCVMVDFDGALAAVPAEDFVRDILVGRLGARRIVVGEDFRFGYRGLGDVALLRELAPEFGFTVELMDSIDDPELGRISSSRVREAVTAGDVERAGRLLGRPAAVRGEVVHGDARGRELGFPTANLGGTVEGLVPADGIYAGWATVNGETHPAAISVGNNPTFTPDAQSRVEAFLLDFSGDLYGATIEVRFVARLRGMVAFTGIEALIERMCEDVVETRRILDLPGSRA